MNGLRTMVTRAIVAALLLLMLGANVASAATLTPQALTPIDPGYPQLQQLATPIDPGYLN